MGGTDARRAASFDVDPMVAKDIAEKGGALHLIVQ
jgi:hypothetical protein